MFPRVEVVPVDEFEMGLTHGRYDGPVPCPLKERNDAEERDVRQRSLSATRSFRQFKFRIRFRIVFKTSGYGKEREREG